MKNEVRSVRSNGWHSDIDLPFCCLTPRSLDQTFVLEAYLGSMLGVSAFMC